MRLVLFKRCRNIRVILGWKDKERKVDKKIEALKDEMEADLVRNGGYE